LTVVQKSRNRIKGDGGEKQKKTDNVERKLVMFGMAVHYYTVYVPHLLLIYASALDLMTRRIPECFQQQLQQHGRALARSGICSLTGRLNNHCPLAPAELQNRPN